MLRKLMYIILLSLVFPQGYNMELVSFMDFGQDVSDITGFYQDGREFGVIGLQNAAAFVDISMFYVTPGLERNGFNCYTN